MYDPEDPPLDSSLDAPAHAEHQWYRNHLEDPPTIAPPPPPAAHPMNGYREDGCLNVEGE